MNKNKIEILLNIIIAVLTVVLATVFALDSRWLFAAAFAVICILNIVGVILRLKKKQ